MPTQHIDYSEPSFSAYVKAYVGAGLFALFFYSPVSFAVSVNAATMVQNIADAVPSLMRLVTAFAFVTGMFLVFKSILGLKQYGESRTMMSSQHELKGPLILMMAGAALLYLPGAVNSGLTTFWTSPNPYAYQTDVSDQWSVLVNDCYLVIQLIGTIAFIRGLLIMSHLGGHSNQPGTFGKAMAHLIGGIFCINIYDFVHTIWTTLAISQ